MSARDHLSGQQFPRVEMTDEQYDSEHDLVHPSNYGLPAKTWKGSYKTEPPHVVEVPTRSIVGQQSGVHGPHVENLARIPKHVLEADEAELPRASRMLHTGGYILDDGHHRVAAANLRRDKTTKLIVDSSYRE